MATTQTPKRQILPRNSPTKTADAVAARRRFGDVIRSSRERNRLTQTDVANKIGSSQSAVANWEAGRATPDSPDLTWKLEELLGFRPGGLSRLLGYLPLSAEADRTPPTFEEAIANDKTLDDSSRHLLLQTYNTLGARRRRR